MIVNHHSQNSIDWNKEAEDSEPRGYGGDPNCCEMCRGIMVFSEDKVGIDGLCGKCRNELDKLLKREFKKVSSQKAVEYRKEIQSKI